jgi:hypothetical protein
MYIIGRFFPQFLTLSVIGGQLRKSTNDSVDNDEEGFKKVQN